MKTKIPIDRAAKTFGERLERLRVYQDVSRADLAAAAGVERMTVYRWERTEGQRLPDWVAIEKIAERLGVTVDYFRDSEPKLPRKRLAVSTGSA